MRLVSVSWFHKHTCLNTLFVKLQKLMLQATCFIHRTVLVLKDWSFKDWISFSYTSHILTLTSTVHNILQHLKSGLLLANIQKLYNVIRYATDIVEKTFTWETFSINTVFIKHYNECTMPCKIYPYHIMIIITTVIIHSNTYLFVVIMFKSIMIMNSMLYLLTLQWIKFPIVVLYVSYLDIKVYIISNYILRVDWRQSSLNIQKAL